eukprot:8574180-Pyramimonas_sp.AAC.1
MGWWGYFSVSSRRRARQRRVQSKRGTQRRMNLKRRGAASPKAAMRSLTQHLSGGLAGLREASRTRRARQRNRSKKARGAERSNSTWHTVGALT